MRRGLSEFLFAESLGPFGSVGQSLADASHEREILEHTFFSSAIQIKDGELRPSLAHAYVLSDRLVGFSNDVRRALRGTNLFFEAPLLEAYATAGDPEAKRVSAEYIQAYIRLQGEDKGGLPLHGNHAFYNVAEREFVYTEQEKEDGSIRTKYYHEINDYYGDYWRLWPIFDEVDPVWTENYAQAIWDRHVFSEKSHGIDVFTGADASRSGQWDRHDQPPGTDREFGGSSWAVGYAHAGSAFIRAFTHMAGRSSLQLPKWRQRAKAIRDFMWSQRSLVGTKTEQGALVPLVSRRDLGRLKPLQLGWDKSTWEATPPVLPLAADGSIQAFMDSRICTSKGYAVYNLPKIFRDPKHPNDSNRVNPLLAKLLVDAHKVCTQTALVTGFWVPALVPAANVFDDGSWRRMAIAIMKAHYDRSFAGSDILSSHHIACRAIPDPQRRLAELVDEDLRSLLQIYSQRRSESDPSKRTQLDDKMASLWGTRLRNWAAPLTSEQRAEAVRASLKIGAVFDQGDCTRLSRIDAEWAGSFSFPTTVPVNSVWDSDISGEDNAMLARRGYSALLKTGNDCGFCLDGLKRIADHIDVVKNPPRIKLSDVGYTSEYGTYAWLYAEALETLWDLHEISAKAGNAQDASRYRAKAFEVANEAIAKLYDPNARALRGHRLAGYEALMGSDALALALARIK